MFCHNIQIVLSTYFCGMLVIYKQCVNSTCIIIIVFIFLTAAKSFMASNGVKTSQY